MIKIIIADDHRMFRESLKKALIFEQVADIIAEACDGEVLLNLLDSYKPDIVLMDIAMPNMDGIEATKKALKKQPSLKVIALSSFGTQKHYFSMVEAGVKGFILKSSGISELKNAITEVFNNNNWFSTELMQKIVFDLQAKSKQDSIELTDREIAIINLICLSFTNYQIAEKLCLSYDTIKWHRSNLLAKTGCRNTAGLVLFAIKNSLIEIN